MRIVWERRMAQSHGGGGETQEEIDTGGRVMPLSRNIQGGWMGGVRGGLWTIASTQTRFLGGGGVGGGDAEGRTCEGRGVAGGCCAEGGKWAGEKKKGGNLVVTLKNEGGA